MNGGLKDLKRKALYAVNVIVPLTAGLLIYLTRSESTYVSDMADIFKNKANVQTAIYVFNVGIPHNTKQIVKFLDFSNDGYTRQNRKKATISTNLRDTDHARERYEEAVNIVLYGKSYMNYFNEETYIEDTISLEGNDWTFAQHRKIETEPSENDYIEFTNNYLAWKASLNTEKKKENGESELQKLKQEYINEGGVFTRVKAKDLFEIENNPNLNKSSFKFVDSKDEYPYFTRTIANNGIAGYVKYLDDEHKINGNVLAVGLLQMKFFYINHDFYAGQFTKSVKPLFDGFNEAVGQYFSIWFNKSSEVYKSALVRDFDHLFNNTEVEIPKKNGKIDVDFIKKYISLIEQTVINQIENDAAEKVKAYKSSRF